MVSKDQIALAKKKCGQEAARLVEDGMILGLGSGSTVMAFLDALIEHIRIEGLEVYGVPTSYDTMFVAHDYGIPLRSLLEIDTIDLAIDGADEVNPQFNLIKGAGGAFTWEKIVANNAKQFIVLIDSQKQVPILGKKTPVPIEVLPLALRQVTKALERINAAPFLRQGSGKLGPVITDFGNVIIDAKFPEITDPHILEHQLNQIPGVIENGIFATKSPKILVGYPDKVIKLGFDT